MNVSGQLSSLLGSNRVLDLRKAGELIQKYPTQARPYLSTVTRRAFHPELTSSFRLLVRYASDQELEAAATNAPERQRTFIGRELGARRMGQRSQMTDAVRPRSQTLRNPSSNAARVASPSTTTPRTSTRTSPPIRPTITNPARPVTSPGNAKGESAMMNLVEQESAKGRLDYREAEQQLASLMAVPFLSDDQWEFLFQLADGEILKDDQDFGRLNSRFENMLFRHSMPNWDRIYQRFVDPATKRPERLMRIICRKSPRPVAVDDRIVELVSSDDPKVSEMALRYFPSSSTRSDEYADKVFEWIKEEPSRTMDFVKPLANCATFASQTMRQRIFEWLLQTIEFEGKQQSLRVPQPSSAERRHLFACSNRAQIIGRRLNPHTQKQAVRTIGEMAAKSDYPTQYLRVLDYFSCDLSDCAPYVKKLLGSSDDIHDDLVYLKYLYMAEGESSNAARAFKNALNPPARDWEAISLACSGIQKMGANGASFVPRLIELIDQTDSSNRQRSIITTLKEIGPAASDAVPRLIKLFSEFEKNKDGLSRSNQELLVQAFEAIGDPAAIPLLMDVASEYVPNSNQRDKAVKALIQIAPKDPRVRALFGQLKDDETLNSYYKQRIAEVLSQ